MGNPIGTPGSGLPPALEPVLRESDLKVDLFARYPHNTMDKGVRVTHLPSGLMRSSSSEDSQLANKAAALNALEPAVRQWRDEVLRARCNRCRTSFALADYADPPQPGDRYACSCGKVYELERRDGDRYAIWYERYENMTDPDSESEYEFVKHPRHYNLHPAGIECIDVIQYMTFNVGTAIKHCWRAGLKPGQDDVRDLRKAIEYLQFEIERLERGKSA